MSRQSRVRSGCFSAVAVWATLLVLVQVLACGGTAAEPTAAPEATASHPDGSGSAIARGMPVVMSVTLEPSKSTRRIIDPAVK